MKPASQSTQQPVRATVHESQLTAALAAIKTYDAGSSRAALLPIDNAVTACLSDPVKRTALERQLVAALSHGLSVVASDYVCAKLALLGGETSIPALVSLLSDARRSDAARHALQSIPGAKSLEALRRCLTELRGLPQIGVIQSLGWRRDAGSVRELAALLKRDDDVIIAATLASLGEIGSARAARVLRAFESSCPASLRSQFGDAGLVCAEHLRASGRSSEAADLERVLKRAGFGIEKARRAGGESLTVR